MSMKLNDTEFKRGLKKFINLSDKELEIGVAVAGMMLMRDCVMETPTVPIRFGDLRGSGSVITQSKLTDLSQKLGYSKGNPAESYNNKKAGQITASIGFNEPYAAKTHEIPMNFRETSAGNDWMTKKMKRYKGEYLKVIKDKLEEIMTHGR